MTGPCCLVCDEQRRQRLPFPQALMRPFIACQDCGNKRCPKATDHGNPCSGSNDPGQPGSAYAALPSPVTPNPTEQQP